MASKGNAERERMKQELYKQKQDSYNSKDFKGGGNFLAYIKPDYQDLVWKIKAGTHVIDIIPFIAGDNMPLDPKTRKAIAKGQLAYVYDFFRHPGIGPDDATVICPRSYGLPCPICEDAKEQSRQDLTKEERSALPWGTRYVLYNIFCFDKGADQDKMMLMNIAHWFFQSHIDSLAHNARTGEDTNFAWIEHGDLLGQSIQFERKGEKFDDTSYMGHKFLPRDYDYSEKDIEEALQLDQIVQVYDYDELAEMYYNKKPEKKEPPAERHQPDPPEESRRRRTEPEEEQPSRTGRSVSDKDNPCPFGHQFAVDIGKQKECEKICEKWDDCLKEEKRLRTEGTGERKEPEEQPSRRASRREPEPEKQDTGGSRLRRRSS